MNKNRQEALKELTEQLEQSIRGFMDGDRYKEYRINTGKAIPALKI